MGRKSIYIRITTRTRDGFGRAINPHLFRDCAATSIAIEDPCHIGIAGACWAIGRRRGEDTRTRT